MDKRGILAQFMLLFTILLISMAIAIFFNIRRDLKFFFLIHLTYLDSKHLVAVKIIKKISKRSR